MKKIYVSFALSWIGLLLSAQVLVSSDKTINHNALLATVQKNTLDSKTVFASGQVVFSSKSGYVRILLSDDNGYDLLVYESSPLLAVKGVDNFTNKAIESIEIPANSALTRIRVEIKNAELKNLSIAIPKEKSFSRSQQQQAEADKIKLINNNLRSQSALWIAGETSISKMTYEEKKGLFGRTVPDLQGFEYYVGGIFELHSDSVTPAPKSTSRKASSFVSSFDWRNRHGANNPSSPYYNGGGHGWITSVKNQGALGSCWMFAGSGVTEALSNLYFNQFVNLDLSEQEAISCCNTCWGSPFASLNYITTDGIALESCFPYTASRATPCSNKQCNTNLTKITTVIGYDKSSEDNLKKMIISNGPLSGTICPSAGCHAMTLIGFGVVKQGDCIGLNTWDCNTIPSGNSSIGKTYWIFKNQWGTNWGESGFVKILIAHNQITAYAAITPIINPNYSKRCVDLDGDGYYFWGIGSKPSTCPCCPNEPDGDDSNPNLGPMDEYGHCESITPTSIPVNTKLTTHISTSQTWNVNQTRTDNISISSGVTLTITANMIAPCSIITIQNGGKLVLSGGTIDDTYILVKNGGELIVQNNGKILIGGYNRVDVEPNASFNMEYGEVIQK